MTASATRVFVHGHDGVGWSIDADHRHVEDAAVRSGFTLARNPWSAEIVHNVWWNRLDRWQWAVIGRLRPVIATATNFIDTDAREFTALRRRVTHWVAPSRRQMVVFTASGVPASVVPFYVEEDVFSRSAIAGDRECLRSGFGLDAARLGDRFVIGSFQRDSEGRDLRIPKWQKGADRLVEIAERLKRRLPILVLLAGPRRHFVRRALEERSIPFVFVGSITNDDSDDIAINTLDKATMARLYAACDSYLVTSRSEGGPKAVLECCWSRCPCVASDVGLAPDFLPPESIYRDEAEAAGAVERILTMSPTDRAELLDRMQESVRRQASKQEFARRLATVYTSLRAEAP